MMKLERVPAGEPSWRAAESELVGVERPDTCEKSRSKERGSDEGMLRRCTVTVLLLVPIRLPWPSKVTRPVPTAISAPVSGLLSAESANQRYVVDESLTLCNTAVTRTLIGMPSVS